MALLEGRNLRKTYRLSRTNSLDALRGVDVSIETGEMVAIMGPSGSGKTTLMHILGLLQSPDQAQGPAPELRFDGADVTRLSDGARTRIRARSMGSVFQSFNLVPTLTALENVLLAADYAGVRGTAARRAAIEVVAMGGLAERAGHRPMELSGGEQQLLLADEPTGNLDSAQSVEVLAMLRRINRERGQTTVIVTHDPAVAASTDRVTQMRDGLIEEGTSFARAA